MSRLRDPQQHDDLLNYQLKRLLALGGAPAIRLCEGRYGVRRFEWRLVAALVEDGPMSPSELSLRTHVEQARVSHAITGLAAKGLVERREHASDRRRATVAATSAGARLYAELFPQLARINRQIMAVLDEREALLLEHYLQRLTDRAQRIYDEGGGTDARADRRLGGSRRFWPWRPSESNVSLADAPRRKPSRAHKAA
ncbi:MAG: MarR family winged helix-turn-helix transcriptional regulator [Burkholderiaceae bacterium]